MSRVRSEGPGFVPCSQRYQQKLLCNGTLTSPVAIVGQEMQEGWTHTTEDVVTPNFHKRSKRGDVIINPFSSTRTVKTGSAGGVHSETRIASCTGTTVKATYDYGGQDWRYVNPLVETGPTTARLRALAGTAAAAGVVEPDVQGLVELAELTRTLRMLANPLEALKKLLNDIRRQDAARISKYKRRAQRTVSFSDYISSEYLRYRYGITPLVATASSALGLLTSGKVRSPRLTSRGFASDVLSASEEADVSSSTYHFYLHASATRDVEVSVRSGVLYEHVVRMYNPWGLSISEVPSASWELVPFSFVADWFVNAGDYIRAVTPKLGVHYLGSWTTILETDVFQHTWSCSPWNNLSGWTIADSRTGTVSETTVRKSRSAGITVALASRLQDIDFEKKRDWLHAADSIALILQSLRRRL